MSLLPPITTLPTLPPPALTAALDLLFEPTPDLHALVLPLLVDPFPSYPALLSTIRDRLHALVRAANHPHHPDKKRALHGILGSHPRLGEPREGVLSEQSKREQRNLKAGGGGGGEAAEAEGRELARLNREYEEVFPGLRYVVFVNGRGRGDAMCDIALDRARKILAEDTA
ncbi:Oxo-4-hydroxy-4-carboxy-5-ureidoimidazoline decarboxylase [Schizothecium vesticola]|uniref:Oxo-4-hydroxy-4-carboxy-5-ureidoimidazoline decarboxylase n=1 Tax=Schizothecium vesticola TaxID=314040 RepID=A0AA40F7S9_9PEZI|nr:Oxo-4-hydroxy-4-carboxy-5-ureidoimidazoline decarboxylase [Schizothecium vesticola]